MVHEDVAAGYIELELHHGRAARRHQRRLYVGASRGGQRALVVHAVEDLTDDVEGRHEVRPADAEVEAHGFAHLGFHRLLFRQPADGAVEDEVLRPFIEQLLDAELLVAELPECGARGETSGTGKPQGRTPISCQITCASVPLFDVLRRVLSSTNSVPRPCEPNRSPFPYGDLHRAYTKERFAYTARLYGVR